MAFDKAMVEAAVKSGDVLKVNDEVTVTAKASPNGKEAKRSYTKYIALTASGMAALCGGKFDPMTPKPDEGDDNRTDAQKEAGACDYFNYGYDLEARATARQALMGELEGPEKQIKKSVISLRGMDYDDETVRKHIMESPKFKGVEGIDRLITNALAQVKE